MSFKHASTVADYRKLARKNLPAFLFHYLDGAAGDELTMLANRQALDAVLLRQRVMRDVSHISTETELLGAKLRMPVIMGPVGLAGLFARRGEVQAVTAARRAGIPYCLSTLGVCTLAEINPPAAGDASWFQLYVFRNRDATRRLLATATDLGVDTLVLTVDVPVAGIRHRDRRFGLSGHRWQQIVQTALHPRWAWDVVLRGSPLTFGSLASEVPTARSLGQFWPWLGANFDPTVSWGDIDFLRRHWPGKVLIKGLLEPADASSALNAGADGLIVSNHGGRQLDGVRPTISALPAIRDAVGNDVPVLVDGAIHSGVDVVRAIASGADACLLGRAWAFALAAGGRLALDQFLSDIQRQIANTMALTGCCRVADLGPNQIDGAPLPRPMTSADRP